MSTVVEAVLGQLRQADASDRQAVFAALLRDLIAHSAGTGPVPVQTPGEVIGYFFPARPTPRTPPPLSPERAEELSRRLQNRDQSKDLNDFIDRL